MQCGLISGIKTCSETLLWNSSERIVMSPVFEGLLHVIKSLIILIASFVRGYLKKYGCDRLP